MRSSQGKKGVFTLRANCSPPPDRVAPIRWSRPGPWSARRAQALCSLHLVASSRSVVFEPLSIDIVPFVGKTVEELIVVVDGRFAGSSVWQTMDRAVCREGDTISLPLSRQTVDELWIEITPTYLPFLKLHDVRLTYRTLVTDIQP